MTSVAVISKTGKRLMPTSAYRARKLLKAGKATVEKYSPIFTIRLTEREDGAVQSIELKCDSGSEHIGISIASATKEYVDEQRDLLPDEKKKHDKRRKYRKERRNRLRYRKARFSNRQGKICEDGFAPSIRNKRDVHVKLITSFLMAYWKMSGIRQNCLQNSLYPGSRAQ